jgi:short subunit dehydrogenase-like uncharacterized protein
MITLLGATGTTGQLTAAALEQAGLPFRLAGRSPERLAKLSHSLPSRPEWRMINIGYTQIDASFLRDTDLLINCAGPFTNLGEAIFRQAALQGVAYLDPANELGYLYRIQSYQRLAVQTGAIMAPACGFEVALADCAARWLAERQPRAFTDIHVVYQLSGRASSPGTRRSFQRALATSWLAWQNSHWVGQAPGARIARFTLGDQTFHALSVPSSESVTIPSHTAVPGLHTWLALSPRQTVLAPLVPYYARFLRSIAGPWLQRTAGRRTLTPAECTSGAPFQVFVAARTADDTQVAVRVTGQAPYGLTAYILTAAAQSILQGQVDAAGIVPPSHVLGVERFFTTAQAWGVALSLVPVQLPLSPRKNKS